MAGDLHVRICIAKHKIFTRKGADLFMEKKVSLVDALTGFSFEQKLLDGTTLKVTTLPGDVVSHNQIKCVKGKGMPFYKDAMGHGNLLITFLVEFPKPKSLNPQ